MRKKIITAERLPQLLSQTIQDRFWSRIAKKGPDDCWLWTRGVNWDGYGVISFKFPDGMKQVRAPQLAWVSEHKTLIPDGKIILHSCKQQPRCCNPAHLRPGTQRENIQDEIDQGTFVGVVGQHHPGAKLTNAKILDIRKMLSSGYTRQQVAAVFGVTYGWIWVIEKRKAWAHI